MGLISRVSSRTYRERAESNFSRIMEPNFLQYRAKTGDFYSVSNNTNTTKTTPYHYFSNPTGKRQSINDKIKHKVSSQRYRIYDPSTERNFDASYIEPRIIAMGLPASGYKTSFRNKLQHVEQYLNRYHGSSTAKSSKASNNNNNININNNPVIFLNQDEMSDDQTTKIT